MLRVCQRIAAALSVSSQNRVDEERLAYAAIPHDIARYDNDKTHHEIALGIIQKEYAEWASQQRPSSADPPDFSQIGKIIRWHKGKIFNPPDYLSLEVSILRLADKIDQVHRKERKPREAKPKKKAKREKKLEEAQSNYEESLELARFLGKRLRGFQRDL